MCIKEDLVCGYCWQSKSFTLFVSRTWDQLTKIVITTMDEKKSVKHGSTDIER